MKSRLTMTLCQAICFGWLMTLSSPTWALPDASPTQAQQRGHRLEQAAFPMLPAGQQRQALAPRHAPLQLLLQRPGVEAGLRALRQRGHGPSLPIVARQDRSQGNLAAVSTLWQSDLFSTLERWPDSWGPLSQDAWAQAVFGPSAKSFAGSSGAKVGDKRTFNVYSFSASKYEAVPTTLIQEGSWVRIWVADGQSGATKVNDSLVSSLKLALEDSTPAGSFDPSQGIVELEQALFGLPPDLEQTGKLNVVITDVQDGWSPTCGCAYTAGFFDPNDLVPGNPSSNGADILYLDAYPSLYTENGSSDVTPALSTAAHEYQHLIHANNGNLYLFQNEGQSEWAQGVTGYPVRAIRYLDQPGATNRSLYRWSSGAEVAEDYQRASLFHAYLAGVAGAEALASITRSDTGGWEAYAPALAPSTRADVLSGFHVANWVNDPKLGANYAYPDAAHAGLRMSTPTLELTGSSLSRTERTVAYGGAEYLRWRGVRDLELTLELTDGMKVMAIQTINGNRSVRVLLAGTTFFSGAFDEVVLVVTTVEPRTSDGSAATELSAAALTYALSGRWTPNDLVAEDLVYCDSNTAYYYASLPYNAETAGATRFTPGLTGSVQSISLGVTTFLSGAANPAGTGSVRLALTQAKLLSGSGTSAVIVPGTELGSLTVPFSSLKSGLNTVDVKAQNWNVVAGTDFFVQVSVESPSGDGVISLDLDAGSTDTSNSAYYPARTRRYFSTTNSWESTWLNNGNIDVRVSVQGQYAEAPGAVTLQSPPEGSTGWLSPLVVTWLNTPAAQRYQLQLSDRADFNNLLWEEELLTPQAVLDELTAGQRYYYRVRASNAAGVGPWSSASFSMLAPPTGEYTLEYVDEANKTWLAALPFYAETQASVRFTVLARSDVKSLALELSELVNELPNPQGTGELQLSLHSAVLSSGSGTSAVYTPGTELGQLTEALTNLQPGVMSFTPSGWTVEPGEYMVVMQVLNPSVDAAVGIVFDNGSPDQTNQEYYPARSRRYIEGYGDWNNTWYNNGNFSLAMTLVAEEVSTPTPTPETNTPTLEPEETPTPDQTPTPEPEATATEIPTEAPTTTPTEAPAETEAPLSPTPSGDDAGGCACSAPGQTTPAPMLWGWAVATLLWLGRRKRQAGR